MGSRVSAVQRVRRRIDRRFYRLLFRVYRSMFPTRTDDRAPLRPADLSRILIVRHDRIGDMVVTTPVLGFLADVGPDVEVDVLASPTNAPVLEADPHVHQVFVRTGWRDWLLLFRRLRQRRYDVIYSFIYGKGFREGLVASAIAGRETRKVSVMRPTQYRGLFTTVVRVPRSIRHMSEHLLYVTRRTIDAPVDRSTRRYPMYIATDAAAEVRASAWLDEHRVGDFVAVNIAAAEPWRQWPWTNCVQVLLALRSRWPELSFVVLAPPDKGADAKRVIDACASDRVTLYPPSPRLLDVVSVVRRARFVVTADTAMVHIACACGRPVVALYSTIRTTSGLWSPYGVAARSVSTESGQPVSTIAAERIVHACEELYTETEPLRA
jgi:ADP-heptose:LPS heptosyltransferase